MNSLNWKKVLISGVIFAVLAVMLFVGVYLVRKPQSQSVNSKAAGTCAPIGWLENPGPVNGATNVSTTPDFSWTFENGSWGQAGDWINLYVWRCPEMVDSCKSIFHTKFETSGPVYGMSWSEAGKVDPLDCNQTYWWQAYVSDACIGPMVPNATWSFTTGCPSQQVGCNQTCNGTSLLCSSSYTCTGGKCVNPTCPTTQDSSCVCPTPAGSCQRVTASKDLSTIKIGDTVTFTGFGTLTNPAAGDSIDKINFIISKDGAEASNTEVVTTLDSAGVWKATKDFPITSPGSYSVRIRVHWLSKNSWLE